MSNKRQTIGNITPLPSGKYRARFTAPDGTRRNLGTFQTRKDASAALAMQTADITRGFWVDPELASETLGEYATRYLSRRELELAPRTVELYRQHLTRFIQKSVTALDGQKITLGQMPLNRLTVPLIAEWYSGVLKTAARGAQKYASGKTLTDTALARLWARSEKISVPDTGRLSPKIIKAWQDAGQPGKPDAVTLRNAGKTTASHAYRTLRMILNAAKRDGLIPANPADIPGAGSVQHVERRPLTPEQVAEIANYMPPYLKASVTVAAWGALRAGEVYALERRHIEITKDVYGQTLGAIVQIEQAIESAKGGLKIGLPKTRASRRIVHLPKIAATALEAHMAAFTASPPTALVFATSTGQIVTPATRQKCFANARKKADLPGARFHDLRHSGATWATLAGGTIKDVMRRLGHTTPRAALIYQHATDGADMQLAAKLDILAGA